MKQKLYIRRMRQHPDLEQLKRQSKELLAAFRAADAAAVNEVTACYDDPQLATFALHDAQLVIARSYGFDSWPKLKAYVDGVTIRRLVEAVSNGAIERVRAMLKTRPELANMTVSYGDEHRAIHYAVMQRQPEITRLLMRKGATRRRVFTRTATPRQPGRWHVNGVTTTWSRSSRKKRTAELNLRTIQRSLQPWKSITPSARLWQMVICHGCVPVWRKASSPITCDGVTAAC